MGNPCFDYRMDFLGLGRIKPSEKILNKIRDFNKRRRFKNNFSGSFFFNNYLGSSKNSDFVFSKCTCSANLAQDNAHVIGETKIVPVLAFDVVENFFRRSEKILLIFMPLGAWNINL